MCCLAQICGDLRCRLLFLRQVCDPLKLLMLHLAIRCSCRYDFVVMVNRALSVRGLRGG